MNATCIYTRSKQIKTGWIQQQQQKNNILAAATKVQPKYKFIFILIHSILVHTPEPEIAEL